jgi:hypothetical protein
VSELYDVSAETRSERASTDAADDRQKPPVVERHLQGAPGAVALLHVLPLRPQDAAGC